MGAREEVSRSRAHARAALDAYKATSTENEQDEAAIRDLMSDLFHLLDEVKGGQSDPERVLARVLDDYEDERERAAR